MDVRSPPSGVSASPSDTSELDQAGPAREADSDVFGATTPSKRSAGSAASSAAASLPANANATAPSTAATASKEAAAEAPAAASTAEGVKPEVASTTGISLLDLTSRMSRVPSAK